MLRGLRKASGNWIGKGIMALVVGFLIISFGIWGIGDMFRGYGLSSVAKVGRVEISVEQFRQAFNERLQQLGRQAGRALTAQQGRDFGLDRQVLSQMMSLAALDQEARAIRLGISDEEVAKRIHQDPSFRGLNGQFDKSNFDALIRQAGFTEQRFIAEQRSVALRKQLLDTVTSKLTIPATEIEALNRYQNEQRDIDYIVLGPAQAAAIAPPDMDVLRKYFDERKTAFRAPEFRKLIVLSLTPEEIGTTISISDQETRQAYETRKQNYATPERRQVQQIVFSNEEEARKAAERLGPNLSFEALAQGRGLKATDFDLGLLAKKDMIDPVVADAAFSLAQDTVSQPIKGRFGVSLLRISRIEPAIQRSFDDVQADLKKQLATDRARTELANRRDKVEDELAGGTRLDEIAQKLQLPFRQIEAVDRSGRGPDGQPAKGLPDNADVVPGAFASQIGIENEPLQVKGGGYVWYEVSGISPSRERTFDEFKDQVEARWRADEVARTLADKARDMLDKIKAGSSLRDVAAANGVAVQTAKGVKRVGEAALPAPIIKDAFRLNKGAVGSDEGKEPTEQFVYQVTDIAIPPFEKTSPEAKNIQDIMKRATEDELFASYVSKLQEKLGSSINQPALNQAIGTN